MNIRKKLPLKIECPDRIKTISDLFQAACYYEQQKYLDDEINLGKVRQEYIDQEIKFNRCLLAIVARKKFLIDLSKKILSVDDLNNDQYKKCFDHYKIDFEHEITVLCQEAERKIPSTVMQEYRLNRYDLALFSSLPDKDANKAEEHTIYLADDGQYVVRDPKGLVKKGKIDTSVIDISNLAARLKESKLKSAIFEETSKAGHTQFALMGKEIITSLDPKNDFVSLYKEYADKILYYKKERLKEVISSAKGYAIDKIEESKKQDKEVLSEFKKLKKEYGSPLRKLAITDAVKKRNLRNLNMALREIESKHKEDFLSGSFKSKQDQRSFVNSLTGLFENPEYLAIKIDRTDDFLSRIQSEKYRQTKYLDQFRKEFLYYYVLKEEMQSLYQKKNDVTNTFAPTDVICETEKFILNLYCKNKAINQFDYILKKVDKYFNSPKYIRLPSDPQDLNEDFSIFSLHELYDYINEIDDYSYRDAKNDYFINLMILLCEVEELSYLAESEENYLKRMMNLKDEFIQFLVQHENVEKCTIDNEYKYCSGNDDQVARQEKIDDLKDKYRAIKNKIVLHIEEACKKPTMRYQKIDPPRDDYDQFVKALKKNHQLELINFARSEIDRFYIDADNLRYLHHINCSIFNTLQTINENLDQIKTSEDKLNWLNSERDGLKKTVGLVGGNLGYAMKLFDATTEFNNFLNLANENIRTKKPQ